MLNIGDLGEGTSKTKIKTKDKTQRSEIEKRSKKNHNILSV